MELKSLGEVKNSIPLYADADVRIALSNVLHCIRYSRLEAFKIGELLVGKIRKDLLKVIKKCGYCVYWKLCLTSRRTSAPVLLRNKLLHDYI